MNKNNDIYQINKMVINYLSVSIDIFGTWREEDQ